MNWYKTAKITDPEQAKKVDLPRWIRLHLLVSDELGIDVNNPSDIFELGQVVSDLTSEKERMPKKHEIIDLWEKTHRHEEDEDEVEKQAHAEIISEKNSKLIKESKKVYVPPYGEHDWTAEAAPPGRMLPREKNGFLGVVTLDGVIKGNWYQQVFYIDHTDIGYRYSENRFRYLPNVKGGIVLWQGDPSEEDLIAVQNWVDRQGLPLSDVHFKDPFFSESKNRWYKKAVDMTNVFARPSFREEKYWMGPDGTTYGVEDHEQWALDNIINKEDQFFEKFSDYWEEDTIDQEEGRGFIFSEAKKRGWIDFTIENEQILVRDDWQSLNPTTRKELLDFAIESQMPIIQWYHATPRTVYDPKEDQ